MKTLLISLLLVLALGPSQAQETDAPESTQAKLITAIEQTRDTGRLIQLAARAGQQGATEVQGAALRRLKQLLPYNREVALELAQFAIKQGNTQQAFNELVLLQSQGLYADLSQLEATQQISGYELWDYLSKLFEQAGEPFGSAEIMFELPEEAGKQPSAVTQLNNTTYVATIDTGEVWRKAGKEDPERFIDADKVELLHAITGMAIDAERDRLWLASAGLPKFKDLQSEHAGMTALFAFDLSSGELIKRYPIADDGRRHQLADIEVDSNGVVYAADQYTPIVLRLNPADETPKLIGGSSQLSSLRALALSKDEQTLYVADYALGLFGIRLGEDEAFPIAAPQEVNLGGIEDLEVIGDNKLVVVQPGVLPQRLLLVELAENHREVKSSLPLAASLPEFAYPLRMELVGDKALLTGNSQLDQAAAKGSKAQILTLSVEPPDSGQRMRLRGSN